MKANKFVILLYVAANALTNSICFGSSSSLEGIPEGPDRNIFSYMNPVDLFNYGVSSKALDNRVINYIKSRENKNNFDNYLMIKNPEGSDANPFIHIDDYLASEERLPVVKIFGLIDLFKARPFDFVDMIIKSIPHKPESILSDLNDFYQNIASASELVNSIPRQKNSHQRLANILIESLMWAGLDDQVESQIIQLLDNEQLFRREIYLQIQDQLHVDIWRQFDNHLDDLIEAQFDNLICDQIFEMREQAWIEVRDKFWTKVNDRVWDKINSDLKRFDFSESGLEENFDRALIPSIDYSAIIYQIGSLALKFTEEFEKLQRSLANLLVEIVTEEQANSILSRIELPEIPENSLLIGTQLKLIRRHLPTEN